MNIQSTDEAKEALKTIGYYRLRGYSFQWYNNRTKKYQEGTGFSDVLKLYQFDTELSHLLFGFLTTIEITLRIRLAEALLIHGDALILMDPAVLETRKSIGKI